MKEKKPSIFGAVFRFLGQDTTKTRQITMDDRMNRTAEKSIEFIDWVQSFTKRIIVVVFAIFIIIDLVTLAVAVVACFRNADSNAITILITETNSTFRDIVGGYLIKAAFENVSMGIEKIVAYVVDKKIESNRPVNDLDGGVEDRDIPYNPEVMKTSEDMSIDDIVK